MTARLSAFAVTLTLTFAPLASAQAIYTTGFEPPTFTLGDVDGQDGWGHISNSPTGGAIEAAPAGSPPSFGVQSLAIRTRNVDFFGVANHLHSASIDPPAGGAAGFAGRARDLHARRRTLRGVESEQPGQPRHRSRQSLRTGAPVQLDK